MQAEGKSFFAALFDYSFNSFATPGLIRVLYIIGTVIIGLGWLGYTVIAFQIAAIAGLIALAFMRVSLEFYYAVVRMSEDIHNRR
jgi:CBS domain containing-hemolysin-like protein